MRSSFYSLSQSKGIAVGALILALLAVAYGSSVDDKPASVDAETIRVVAAVHEFPPVAPPSRNVAPVMIVPPAQALEEAIAARFPILRDAVVECHGQDCQLSALLPPPRTEREQDDRETMLLGALERFVAAQGHPQNGSVQLDEIGEEEYRIRVPLTRAT
ncbi:hypothetical protein [Sphingomonas carotinifaciens]|uniref:Uncharacterized protein n=1 Tax=Sphingomonas carotinifaciens TaxID=1166323 RepID=A0A1G7S6S3_9SPHN|nr:hypothetical protein [Sphingomonas carotinifaciens]MBB4088185.1 hypothetical protein [Sphingomonas carotinifaciens]MWC42188.1 hypothetical protein [Sphingomonas carotinifaciens]SDG17870.1 hypothetical protein SAMN05216557_1192 [Sphingomonas carotinifaciens]